MEELSFIIMRFKALVFVRLRGSVSDAAGNAVMNNVKRIAPKVEPHLLRIGKCIDFWFDAESEEVAREQMDLLSDRMLANTVIEDWEYDVPWPVEEVKVEEVVEEKQPEKKIIERTRTM